MWKGKKLHRDDSSLVWFVVTYLRKWILFDLPIYLIAEIKLLCTRLRSKQFTKRIDGKILVCDSEWNKLYPAMPPHLAKRKFTFILFFFSSFPTNKNCYFIAKPYLYVFCCSTKLGIVRYGWFWTIHLFHFTMCMFFESFLLRTVCHQCLLLLLVGTLCSRQRQQMCLL